MPHQLRFNETTSKVEVHVEQLTTNVLVFYPLLATILGFKPDVRITESRTGDTVTNLKATITSLYIYTSIIRASMVGDSTATLLQMAPVERTQGDTIKHTFFPGVYFSLRSFDIRRIDVAIADAHGKDIDFEFGHTVVHLHFRRKGVLI